MQNLGGGGGFRSAIQEINICMSNLLYINSTVLNYVTKDSLVVSRQVFFAVTVIFYVVQHFCYKIWVCLKIYNHTAVQKFKLNCINVICSWQVRTEYSSMMIPRRYDLQWHGWHDVVTSFMLADVLIFVLFVSMSDIEYFKDIPFSLCRQNTYLFQYWLSLPLCFRSIF
jgi:hypothetical protein